ncbi:MAG TPA: ABC transporter permease [Micromonosporaceae bacterium]|nr:ABC transporter permease [Micromonosporaceae bacterium]
MTEPANPPEKRESLGRAFLANVWTTNPVTVTVLAFVLAMITGGILIVVSDPAVRATFSYFFARPGDALTASWDVVSAAYANLLKGAIVDPQTVERAIDGQVSWKQVFYPISETLLYATPLIFTGLAVAIAFRGGLFNIGAEGQVIMGGIAAALAGFLLPLPYGLHLLVALLAGALGGAFWGSIAGGLKARTGAHEVITTIMLNYIALYFLGWLILQDGIQDPGRTDAISSKVDQTARLPLLVGDPLRVHLGIVLAILVTFGVAWVLRRSTFGFELRAVGLNPDAARTAGMGIGRTYTLVMLVAGALAGLAGSSMALGTAFALTPSFSGNVGFTGITVALLGRAKPWGVLLAGLLFGAMQAGGNRMQIASQISIELVVVLQALIVIFVAAPALVKAIFQLRTAKTGRLETSMARGW